MPTGGLQEPADDVCGLLPGVSADVFSHAKADERFFFKSIGDGIRTSSVPLQWSEARANFL